MILIISYCILAACCSSERHCSLIEFLFISLFIGAVFLINANKVTKVFECVVIIYIPTVILGCKNNREGARVLSTESEIFSDFGRSEILSIRRDISSEFVRLPLVGDSIIMSSI